ncbi:MAG: hypothetical protein A3A96_02010 [Candidatus Zambryskibacteria bacterium RIFCSPLOWO2_01_FULL_39_39]|uniref:Bacterial bifunctional deaminase-reductase C-terminal domain-containing protein n=1 Tax=Candidatus Zambryskibacteria bacterium RIFCSPLOWO2_01_FULL_39_39 TaxID=1802758 RepID=A0A1G2TVZ4_9BACT|nr:MAG: hypothetical protein A2644_01100 [Candidatus Zambryskibacteria bacterium RIFCSPHIGHO2_01_FULL_39_63]OHA94723.1 MAG: hypothetical protein A3B88_01400 [Candidatus Zambryskibacteria bacterium RIFCSPHIGHO2_02_FULL_39_19]OHA98254.1 MAG: hypothetical protein A3F20_01440 [Candidatus Zambryskibacteria bacterium RIFCSPHIGHO2_12_FULL_39_21]OHB01498.1 MAG: hypothetical protein A3A96_02010 [Candidatus Zambryskibacteria bacterium RIFCSPLOWO2_01_FULL_39_39]
MITLYNVVSADGYIARKDGSEDFIPNSYWPHTLNVLNGYDCIIVGRKTYDVIQNYEENMRKSFEDLPIKKIVITKDKSFHPKEGFEVAYALEDVINPDLNIVVTSGPTLNNYLVENNFVDKNIYKRPLLELV